MAMKSYQEAIGSFRSNPRAHWSPNKPEAADGSHAMNRIHRDFSDIAAPEDFSLSRDASFFCIGSCFARELEDAIDALGLNALTRQRSLELIAADPELFSRVEGALGRPNAFLNRYNSGSMVDLMEGVVANSDKYAALYSNGSEKFYDYHFTRFLVALPEAEAKERRDKIIKMYHNAAKEADVFVFTLGLCESFYDLDENAYLNVTPDPRTARGHNIQFRFLGYQENLTYARRIISLVKDINPDADIILTVSPVPLDSTFTGEDIVVANTLAKSTLLAVAREVTAEEERCHYFPSYEMVTSSSQELAWLWDKKHVSPNMVRHIMGRFTNNHIR